MTVELGLQSSPSILSRSKIAVSINYPSDTHDINSSAEIILATPQAASRAQTPLNIHGAENLCRKIYIQTTLVDVHNVPESIHFNYRLPASGGAAYSACGPVEFPFRRSHDWWKFPHSQLADARCLSTGTFPIDPSRSCYQRESNSDHDGAAREVKSRGGTKTVIEIQLERFWLSWRS